LRAEGKRALNPVYQALRKAGKVRKCEWAEKELLIQKAKKEKRQNA
jgi:hypothetical protein